jgi:hypothetical protein
MARYVKEKIEFHADDVWAAACAAQRINQRYIKATDPECHGPDPRSTPNRTVMQRFLGAAQLLTEADREQGRAVRRHFQGLTFKLLQGLQLNDFQQSALTSANKEIVDSTLDIAIIASLPASYERDAKAEATRAKLDYATGGLIGQVGSKVEAQVTVLKSVYSHNWNVYFVSGITAQEQSVFFSFREGLAVDSVVQVKGTVKAHKGNTTQLNRVKLVQ